MARFSLTQDQQIAAHIPAVRQVVKSKKSPAVVYLYTSERDGKPSAMAFYGKAGKPAFWCRFRDAERRAAYVANWLKACDERAAYKADTRAKRAAYVHDVKPGDIFRSSWGYDQTNIDYYQCVRLIGSHMMEVREIQQQSEETLSMQGKCVPAPGQWATEAYTDEDYKREHGCYPRRDKASFRVKVQGYEGGEPYFKVASYANATRIKPVAEVAGVKMYAASHWTAYA